MTPKNRELFSSETHSWEFKSAQLRDPGMGSKFREEADRENEVSRQSCAKGGLPSSALPRKAGPGVARPQAHGWPASCSASRVHGEQEASPWEEDRRETRLGSRNPGCSAFVGHHKRFL